MHRNNPIVSLEGRALNVPLRAPFVIASTRLEHVENVAVRIVLEDGTVGWGESPSLPPVTAENQAILFSVIKRGQAVVLGQSPADLPRIAARLNEEFPEAPSARTGIETAILDAYTRHQGLPLYRYFGGASDSLTTDITVPICAPEEAEELARQYFAAGFEMIKTKVGINVDADIERLRAIRIGHPACRLLLDANEGYSPAEALGMIDSLRRQGIVPDLLEQPVPKEDWEGLGRVSRESPIPVAADESCRSVADAERISRDGLAQIINIKLVKSGVVESQKIATLAKRGGIRLMIGGMVETRLAMGFSAHFAAGIGGFEWIDLDTPLLLAEDPVLDGYRADGPRYDLSHIRAGHGASIHWDED
jgi:L-alanine-DL-glutamate epimerase-like enolase superfamily enzyme